MGKKTSKRVLVEGVETGIFNYKASYEVMSAGRNI